MEPQFKVHGMERRKLKQELSQLKSFVRMFWHYHQLDKDMASVYGGHEGYPMSDEKAQECLDKAKAKATELESILSEPYERS